MTVECLLVLCLVRPPERPVPEPWRSLAECESDRTWDEGDGGLGPFRGGLQFHPRTWEWLRPSWFPRDPARASAAQEVAVAQRVLRVQGWSAWPVCAAKLGLLQGGSNG